MLKGLSLYYLPSNFAGQSWPINKAKQRSRFDQKAQRACTPHLNASSMYHQLCSSDPVLICFPLPLLEAIWENCSNSFLPLLPPASPSQSFLDPQSPLDPLTHVVSSGATKRFWFYRNWKVAAAQSSPIVGLFSLLIWRGRKSPSSEELQVVDCSVQDIEAAILTHSSPGTAGSIGGGC